MYIKKQIEIYNIIVLRHCYYFSTLPLYFCSSYYFAFPKPLFQPKKTIWAVAEYQPKISGFLCKINVCLAQIYLLLTRF